MLLWLSRRLCALPLSTAMRLARQLGWLWYYVIPVRRRLARANIARVYGPLLSATQQRRMVRQSCVNLCYYAMEGLRMPALTAASSEQYVRTAFMAQVDSLLQRQRGIIAVTAHLGNFDLLGTSQTVRGYPVHAIVKDIKWPAGQQFWQAVRQATGLGRIAPRRAWPRLLQLLQQNQIVAFLIDQHLPAHRAIVSSFFGQPAATTPAPVRLALQTGAPIMPIFMLRRAQAGYHQLIVGPEFNLEMPHAQLDANIAHNTQRLNHLLEAYILSYPEQWLWQHKRWKLPLRPAHDSL